MRKIHIVQMKTTKTLIDLQKSLIFFLLLCIIILYYCIYLKVRAKNGFKYRTLVLHERNL